MPHRLGSGQCAVADVSEGGRGGGGHGTGEGIGGDDPREGLRF